MTPVTLWLCWSDGERELRREPWYRSMVEAARECHERNREQRHGDDDHGFWYVDDSLVPSDLAKY